jgi:hypothetical protein
MTTADLVCLKAYTTCIRKMFDGIRGLGLEVPSGVVLWLQGLEARVSEDPEFERQWWRKY